MLQILSLLDASNQAMPVILHRHQQQQQELIAALTSSPTTNTNDIAEPRQRLYDQLAAFFASTDDQATALLLLQSLVSLTRGTRKARDVGGLFHSVLSTVYPSTEIASLKDILPLDLLLPTTAFAKSPLRVRAGMTAKDFTAIVLRRAWGRRKLISLPDFPHARRLHSSASRFDAWSSSSYITQ